MPLVLVHNDVVLNPAHAWDDVEGEHYHYPSKYQRKIQTGEPFVYYRGVNRVGGRRGPAEYVGAGRIGEIWLDPATQNASRKAWYCRIEDYQRFAEPVPAKVDGVTLEQIPSNLWRDGVRSLDPAVYARIIERGGYGLAAPALIPAAAPQITAADNLIVPATVGGPAKVRGSYRKSRQAKATGDWAEQVALRYIQEQIIGCADCTHRAALGETPGWDLDYIDASGALQRVEVKGTTGAAFSSIDLTAGEMRAAKTHGASYWLCLVAGCLTASPKVQLVQDPAKLLTSGTWSAAPAVYQVRFQGMPGRA